MSERRAKKRRAADPKLRIERDYYNIVNRKPQSASIADLNALNEVACALDTVTYLESIDYHLFEWQKAVLRDTHQFICILGCRQSGKSTIMSAKVCHWAKYHPGSLCIILAPSQDQAKIDTTKIKEFIDLDPNYPALKHDTAQEILLENKALIKVVTASDKAARGFSKPDIVLFDEASRISDETFDAVLPMITSNPLAQMIEISTPFGKKGAFYRHFTDPGMWQQYLVRSPWKVVDKNGHPDLEPTDITFDLVHNDCCLGQDNNCFMFASPRHTDYKEQLRFLRTMGIQQYMQEECCQFVTASDQVFAEALISRLFTGREVEMENSEADYDTTAELDPEFMEEYLI